MRICTFSHPRQALQRQIGRGRWAAAMLAAGQALGAAALSGAPGGFATLAAMRGLGAALATAAVAAVGCREAGHAADPAGPQIEGQRIVYPSNAPELASLTTTVAQAARLETVRTTGRLAWDEDRTARVFPPVGGRVAQMLADLEQKVTHGSPLASLESPDYGQAQADADRAQTDLGIAERSLARVRDLYDHQAAPQKDVESAAADRDRARAERDRAHAHLTLLGGTVGTVDQRFVLRSPISGLVVERAINPGLEVRTDGTAPLFVISDPSRLWVLLDVVEQDLPRVRRGQALLLRCNAYPQRTFPGRVEVVGDSLDPATRTVKARGSVENPDHLLKAEMYVEVDVAEPSARPGVEVPSAAVVADGGHRFVFVEEAPGRFARQPVETGAERAGRSRVVAGLAVGQRVVVEGSLLLESMLTPGA